jgi:serine/threonine protein kinase
MSSPFILAGGPEARVGTVVNAKWRLERLLGIGGMAAVYAARHRNGSRAAVKMLHPDLAVHASIRDRFLREAYATNAVEHPGVLRVLDDDVAPDGSVFLVMDLLDGEALDAFVARQGGRVDGETAVSFVDAILEVLVAAHERGVIHRDIKPQNVFLTRDGHLKVLDFGIAFVGAQSEHATRTGTTMGTPAFMPAEQARGRWESVDAQSDVWAVGATLYYLLTGRLVHEAATPNETLLAAMTQSAHPLQTVAPDVSPALAAVVDKALCFDKRDRWVSARAMLDALRETSLRCTEPFLLPAPVREPAPGNATERPAPRTEEPPSERAVAPPALAELSPSVEPAAGDGEERSAFLPYTESEAPTAYSNLGNARGQAVQEQATSSFATAPLVHAPAGANHPPERLLPRMVDDDPGATEMTVRISPKLVRAMGIQGKVGPDGAVAAASSRTSELTPRPGVATDPRGAPPVPRRLTFGAPALPMNAGAVPATPEPVGATRGAVVTAGAWGVTGVPKDAKDPRDAKNSDQRPRRIATLGVGVGAGILVGLGLVLLLAAFWGRSEGPPSELAGSIPVTSSAPPATGSPASEGETGVRANAAEGGVDEPVDAGLDDSADGGTPPAKGAPRPNKRPPTSIY